MHAPARSVQVASVLFSAPLGCGLIISLVGALLHSSPVRLAGLGVLLFGRLDLLWRAALTRQGAQAAGLLALAALLYLRQPVRFETLAFGVVPYGDVIVMLITVGLLRPALQQDGLREWVGNLLSRMPSRQRGRMLLLVSTLIAPALSMGTISVMGAITAGQVRPERDVAVAVIRGVLIAMIWAPSFMPIALLLTSFPDVSWQRMAMYTVPVAVVASVMIASVTRPQLEVAESVCSRQLPIASLAMLLVNTIQSVSYMFVMKLPALIAVTLASAVTVALWARLRAPRWWSLSTQSAELWKRLLPDMVLFGASGIASVVIARAAVQEAEAIRALVPLTAAISPEVFIIVLLPLTNLLRLHPIVAFTLFAPVLDPGMSSTQAYLAWLAYWCLSLAISPVSMMNLAACSSFGVSMTTLRSHMHPLSYVLIALSAAWGVGCL